MKASNSARQAISTQSPFFFSISERRSEPHLHHDPTGILPPTHLDGIPWWGRWSGSNLSLEPHAKFHGEPCSRAVFQGNVPSETCQGVSGELFSECQLFSQHGSE